MHSTLWSLMALSFSAVPRLIAILLMRFPLSPAALCKAKKRRANLLYKLRRKGIEADTKQRVIFIPYGEEPRQYVQAVRLCREFNFNIQFIIT